ncbi:unnamed protein product [Vitrella brassicaformis CCMP3155]|uniref:Uncharacterized protein n=1 Tax=Vitrella brassicaformis (strain CCMP3155) TaxID=1169540 RepID=A0A0G4EY84_VITBC|nr:unnamed protein product [Vitrella brassicaformis CCMP3155]|eukprot:CEM04090.1 unnamed protein product [Vitrella brassicaformis CCMP3155]
MVERLQWYCRFVTLLSLGEAIWSPPFYEYTVTIAARIMSVIVWAVHGVSHAAATAFAWLTRIYGAIDCCWCDLAAFWSAAWRLMTRPSPLTKKNKAATKGKKATITIPPPPASPTPLLKGAELIMVLVALAVLCVGAACCWVAPSPLLVVVLGVFVIWWPHMPPDDSADFHEAMEDFSAFEDARELDIQIATPEYAPPPAPHHRALAQKEVEKVSRTRLLPRSTMGIVSPDRSKTRPTADIPTAARVAAKVMEVRRECSKLGWRPVKGLPQPKKMPPQPPALRPTGLVPRHLWVYKTPERRRPGTTIRPTAAPAPAVAAAAAPAPAPAKAQQQAPPVVSMPTATGRQLN